MRPRPKDADWPRLVPPDAPTRAEEASRATVSVEIPMLPGVPRPGEPAPEWVGRPVPDAVGRLPRPGGLTWVLVGQWLYQIRAGEAASSSETRGGPEARALYVGDVEAAAAAPLILPRRDRVLVVFDTRLLVFDRSGAFLRTIEHPRPVRGDTPWTTASGVGSAALDADGGLLYLVQGYRVVQVDLDGGTASTFYAQLRARFGPLALRGGKLFVMLDPEAPAGACAEPSRREVLVFDLATRTLQRVLP